MSDGDSRSASAGGRWGRARAKAEASGATDAGGAESVNQDAHFALAAAGGAALVVGVFDGHGKEAGRCVARAACAFFEQRARAMEREELDALEREPRAGFRQMFAACHEAVKETLRDFYEAAGFVVYEQPDGFLVKQDPATHLFANVRGGTTATIVVVLDGGRKVLAANVGDSTALIGCDTGRALVTARDVKIYGGASKAGHADASKMRSSSHAETEEEDDDDLDAFEIRDSCTSVSSSANSSSPGDIESSSNSNNNMRHERTELVALTGDHGADSVSEFLRIRRVRCCDSDPSMPELRFLYDSSNLRTRRLPIFSWSESGELSRNYPGDYFKNVRDEWATVVATPLTSLFPDALAFTRSLGDLHMHAYGVSCEPTVVELSLDKLLARELGLESDGDNQSEHLSSNQEQEEHIERFTLVVATDGVWDNWKYEELFHCLHDVRDRELKSATSSQQDESVARAMVSYLMQENLTRAEETFGDQADNMTAVVCTLELAFRCA